MEKNTISLPADVAEQYELVGWKGSAKQFFGAKFRYVDVSIISLDKAAWLVANGFRQLKKKAERKKPAKAEKE